MMDSLHPAMIDARDDRVIMRLDRISKSYGSVPIVRELSLDLCAGEFLSLLGPSGCGKTTTLRMVAGLERPDRGHVVLRGRDITGDPPHRRPVNTVFQDYALFPHLSVERNVGFGLAMQRVAAQEIRRRVADMLSLVGLDSQAQAHPATLSGGQRQRVALARALVRQPEMLLLDEPLSALDVQLRQQMQSELKALQSRLGITFLLVTHDQTEALSLSDRIAVMQAGRIVQLGAPETLYDSPRTAFVARFLGATNLLPSIRCGDTARLLSSGTIIRTRANDAAGITDGDPCLLNIRPGDIELADRRQVENVLEATILGSLFHGGVCRLECGLLDGTRLLVDLSRRDGSLPAAGEPIRLSLPPARVSMLPPEN